MLDFNFTIKGKMNFIKKFLSKKKLENSKSNSENFFSIVIDCCNQEKWIERCLKSCINQDFSNFEVVLVDALSQDKTYEIAKKYSEKIANLRIYQNEVRLPQIANMVLLTKLSRPNSIIVSVDGDDWLPHNKILQKLDQIYCDNVWMTYGTYKEYTGFASYRSVSHVYKAYPEDVIAKSTFREYPWLASHLRTYRRELFLKIDELDFKREDGYWLDTTGDQAFMFPMLEMAGSKSLYIKDIMYIYNVADLQRDGHVNEIRQLELSQYIRSKNKYSLIDTL